MLQKQYKKTADSLIVLKSVNLRLVITQSLCRNYPTKLIIFPGTIINLFGVLPCN